MQRRSTLLSFAAIAATALVVAMGGAAYADTVIVDGDTVATNVQSSVNLGTVACSSTTNHQVAIWIERGGNGQVFASGASVAISGISSVPAVLNVPASIGTIAIPSGWDAAGTNNNGTDTSKVTTQLTLAAPASSGSGSATVTISALGTKSSGDSTKPVTGTLTVTWNVATCVTKTDTTTTVSCPASATYTGSALAPCTAAVKDSGNQTIATPTVTYTGGHTNVSDSPVTASASYGGDSTHNPSAGSATFTISPAPSTTTVSCPASAVYTGSALTPCTARATGVGGLDTAVNPIAYTGNTNVGTAQASATYAGDGNHRSSTANGSFAITGATATCSVSGYTGTYDGAVHGATGSCTGLNGTSLNAFLDLGTSFADVPGGTASWSLAAPNYLGQSGAAAIAIGQATSAVALTCSDTVYTGAAQHTCHATVTGAGGLSADVDVTYTGNTDAGTATAKAAFAGDADHSGSSAQTTFTIAKAPSTTSLSCVLPVTYTGAALTPCTAQTTGAGAVTGSPQVAYSDNTNAGTGSVSAHFAGDANHQPSDDKATFAIGKAGSTVALSCPASVVYSAAAQTPCTATVSAVGLDDFAVDVTYAGNTDAGDATASAAWAGDGNHDGSTTVGGFHIDQAPSATIVDCPTAAQPFTGSAIAPCTAKVTGPGLDTSVAVTYTAHVHPGTVHASAAFAGDANHTQSTGGSQFDIVKASTSVAIVCGPTTYDGTAQKPCTATVTSPSDLSLSADVTPLSYDGNVEAGTANVTASYTGDGDHEGSTANTTFTIGKASSSIMFNCDPVTYTGSPLTPCTATASGAGNLVAAVTGLEYTDNTDAGDNTAGVSGAYAGDANHDASTGSTTFTIGKASSSIMFSCDPVTYTGSPLTPCTAQATGAGGLEAAVTGLKYADNTNAGVNTAGVSGSYGGDDNHTGTTGSDTFSIGKASSSIAFSCDAVIYTGSALTPCSALVSGAGDLSASVSALTYTNNTNAGVNTAGVSGSYGGDANHNGTDGQSTFTIGKASSSITFTCTQATYSGEALTPCTATASGAGNLVAAVPDLTYTNNTNAGDDTAGVSAVYAGDTNHDGSSGSTTFSIDKALSSITIACDGVTYDGMSKTPCKASVAGANLSQDMTGSLVYTGDTINAGTAHASVTYAGDGNHIGADKTVDFAIGKAGSAVTVTCPVLVYFTGSPVTPCTAVATGIGLNQPITAITYTNNTAVGSAGATATYAGDKNHDASYGSGGFQIGAWTGLGFYKPVDMNGVVNIVKSGSTVPLKFNVYAGQTEITDLATLNAKFSVKTVSCTTNALVSDDLITTTGGTSLRYDTTGRQWVQNWQVPAGASKCYQVTLSTSDGSQLTALFKTK